MQNNTIKTKSFSSDHDSLYRDQLFLLRSRLSFLTGQDKFIMLLYTDSSMSLRQIAPLLGMNVSSLSRRIRKIILKLTRGTFVTCLKNKEQFTAREMSIARDYFLRGHSIKQIARRNNSTFYHIRQKLHQIEQTASNL